MTISSIVCVDTVKGPSDLSQAAIDNWLSVTNFDLGDQTFNSLFQIVKPCQYFNFISLPCHSNNDKLDLLHLNMWSLKKKNYDDLHTFFSDLSLKPHIIAISEIKLKDKPLINISIPGYTLLHTNSVSNAGGVGIYVPDLLKFNILTFKSPSFGCETLWISVTSSANDINYVTGVVQHQYKYQY